MNFTRKENDCRIESSLDGRNKRKRLVSSLFLVLFSLVFALTSCANTDSTNLNLTTEEQTFINEHPVVNLGVDPEFVPFEFFDEEGEYKGVTADYLSIISERTGLEFEVRKGLTWPQAYDMAVNGDLDALPAIGKTTEREEHFLFSDPYYHFKRVLVTKNTNTEISDITDLEGKTVAVQRNSSHHSYLLAYPNIILSLYDSVEAALAAVATGEEIAFVGNLATTIYLINYHGLTNLRVVAFEAEISQALYFAVRKDWPLLISIFNKALNTITNQEKQAINNKWVSLRIDVDYGPIIRILVMIGAFIVAILGVSFFWIVRLNKEIKQRKQTEIDLEKARRQADEANDFKTNFLARMSHEIRTPLNAITGMSYLLKKTNLTLTQKMYADRVTQASSNMLNIVNDILDFSKIESGKVVLESASFSLDRLIQDVVNIVSFKIKEQAINFSLFKDPFVPNWFIGDAKRIEQILLNVLNNAAKFTNHGEIFFTIRLSGKDENKFHLTFTIKDTGIGMDQEQIERLFMPFVQGDSSINRRFGGSGLGLSIVKNLLDLMGGQIQVSSAPNEGSTFVINLSLSADKEKETAYRKTLSEEHFKNIRVLVIEKTEAKTKQIESYLNAIGLHPDFTSSTAETFSMLEAANNNPTQPFDLLIIDYETIAGEGLDFVKAVHQRSLMVKQPKTIILLPMMREDLFDQLANYGIDFGIAEPFVPSTLFNGILEALKLKKANEVQPVNAEKVDTNLEIKTYQILVVEDNKTNQLITKSLLQQIGAEVILASDGKEAVELYNSSHQSINLILMDLHMPVMNGYEAAAEIRKKSATVPIIAMTADVILGVKEKCAECGIYYYISKPFEPEQFLKTIKDIILENHFQALLETKMLDSVFGLKNMGNSHEIYQKVLDEYFNENQNTLKILSRSIADKRYAEAEQIIHKVKSSSGSIGAKTIYEWSRKLQKALNGKDEDEIVFLYKQFEKMFNKLLVEISDFKTINAENKEQGGISRVN